MVLSMARPLRISFPGAFYHITSRGNERKAIYKSRSDRLKFLSYLESATARYAAVIHCYCLMGNHYHLLLETPSGNLPQIMRHINGAYTTYFNTKRDRSGHLFQGRYKAILVEKDAYTKELSRYIHLNPVRAGLVDAPDDYEWTSYQAYIGAVPSPEWLTQAFILGYFSPRRATARKQYAAFVNAALGADYDSPLEAAVGGLILGNRAFVEKIRSRYLDNTLEGRDLPELKKLQDRPSASLIDAAVERLANEEPTLVRNLKIYFHHKYSGRSLKELGRRFGIGESAVSQVCRRLNERKAGSAKLDKMMHKIDKNIQPSKVQT